MPSNVKMFGELTTEQQSQAGGKAAHWPIVSGGLSRARWLCHPALGLCRRQLTPEAWAQIQAQLAELHAAKHDGAFAVRSSALSEDSAQHRLPVSSKPCSTSIRRRDADRHRHGLSFAHSERVQAYSQVKGLAAAHEIAVVVQHLVCAESSGVMFTANPITASVIRL